MCSSDLEDVDILVDRFGRYPQKLSNLTLRSRDRLDLDRINDIAAEAQARMEGRGRIFIRPSGTEPLLRILVEANELSLVEEMSNLLIERLRGVC